MPILKVWKLNLAHNANGTCISILLLCSQPELFATFTAPFIPQKAKLEAKLHQTTAAAAAAASAVGPVHNSVPSNPVAAPGFFIHPSDVIPPTPKTTPLFMTPPLTPPNEAVSAVISAELAQLFPGSVIDPPTVNLAAHNKNTSKTRTVIILICFL